MITLCLSVEPKHLAAAFLPDVLTPITLLEVTLRSQATQLDPTNWQRGFLMAASADGSSSSSSQPASVPDLQPVALRVAEALSAALSSDSFRAAVNDPAATALSDQPSVNQQRLVLLQQMFTLCVTCLKVGQAAAAGGRAGLQHSAAGAAAIPSAVLSCSSQPLTLLMESKDWAACVSMEPAACGSGSSSTRGQQRAVNSAVLLPFVVLVARALYMCGQQLGHQPQQQFTATAAGARLAQQPHAAVNSADTAVQQEIDAEERDSLIAQLTRCAKVVSDGLVVLESFLSSCDDSNGRWVPLRQQDPFTTDVDKLSHVDAKMHHAQAATGRQAVPAPRVYNRDHLLQLVGDLQASPACVAASNTADLSQHSNSTHLRQQVIEQLSDFALSVCSSIPLALCCNNPDCQTLFKLSESQLVGGKACVCAGCEVARYCGGTCQRAHWSRHKATCRMVKKEKATEGSRI